LNSKIKIAIASGKGGTGKTFISTNLFASLAKCYNNVTLLDCDAEEPNDREFIAGEFQQSFDVTQKVPVIDESKCVYCGKCYEYCNYNAIFFLAEPQMIRVLEEHCHGCGACSVACEYGAITEKDDVLGTVASYTVLPNSKLIEARMKVGVHSAVPVIKAAVKVAATANIVLLDSPPGTSCPFIQTVAAADYIVLVTEPTPFGLSDLKQSVDTLRSMGKKCGVVVNRAGLGNDEVYKYLVQENIQLLMTVPFDKEIAMTYSQGRLLCQTNPLWEEKFIQLFTNICSDNGNCNN
jgi:MinD superfamily P-loop ATPase